MIVKLLDLCAWLNLLLLPVCTLNLYMPKNSNKERSGVRKKLQIASINEALATWKEPYGCYSLVQKVLELSKPNHHQQKRPPRKVKDANLEACIRKLSNGHHTAAICVLSSNGVASSTPDTLHELQLKHPSAPPPIIPADNPSSNALHVDYKSVLQDLKSFPKGTACGRDGLRAQHLLGVLSGAAAAIAEDFLQSIVGVVNLWKEGRCPTILGEFFANAPLTLLLKSGGGLRPIAVGTIWRRLFSKLDATLVCKYLTTYIGNHQFGVGVPCGGEAILHSANKLVELKGSQDNMTMMLVDITNAFNMVDMTVLVNEVISKCLRIARWVEFCYSKPARLYYNDVVLSSAKGVQQDDLLGPLIFALILHPLVMEIASECTLDLHAWYLDDCTIAGDTMEFSKALSIVQAGGPARGLHLSVSKTEIFWPTNDPRRETHGVFPYSISRPIHGVKLLGGAVSLDLQYYNDLVAGRVEKSIHLMKSIKNLKDP